MFRGRNRRDKADAPDEIDAEPTDADLDDELEDERILKSMSE